MRTPTRGTTRLRVAAAALVICSACHGGPDGTEPEVPSRVGVAPQAVALDALGASRQLHASAYTDAGKVIAGVHFSWRSSDPAVATVAVDGNVSTEGTVTSTSEGTATVVAGVAGVPGLEGSALVTVSQAVASVVVSPAGVTLDALGASAKFGAAAFDALGHEVAGRTVIWSSSSPTVATVDGAGSATAVGEGTTTVTAEIGGRTGSVSLAVKQSVEQVDVRPPTVVLSALGDSAHLEAIALDPGGHPVTGRTSTWRSSDAAVASVADAGIVVAGHDGSAQVTASVEGVEGSCQVEVRQVAAHVVLEPASLSFDALNGTAPLTPAATDARGAPVDHVSWLWTSSDPSVAAVAPQPTTGVITAVGNGDAYVRATADNAVGEALVHVRQRIVLLDVGPKGIVLGALGAQAQLAVTAFDPGGTPVADPDVHWSTSDPGVATVSDAGVVTAIGNGLVMLQASVGDVVGTVDARVAQRVSRVDVTPGVSPLAPGNHVPLHATLTDALGWPVAGATCSWSSDRPDIAGVDGSGMATAMAEGTTSVRCTSMGVQGLATVNVVSAGWPHLPPGLAVVSDNAWDALASAGWDHVDRASQSRIVSDATAPLSQPHVLEDTYPVGFPGSGTEPATDWIELNGARELYVGAWFKASQPWQGHISSINKIFFFFFTADYVSQVVFTMRGPPGGPYHLQPVLIDFPDGRSNVAYLDQNVAAAPVTPGRWHRFEFHFVRGTAGNGIVRWWQDGALLGEYTDVSFPAGDYLDVHIAPTWGGVGGPNKAENDFFRFDHVVVAKR